MKNRTGPLRRLALAATAAALLAGADIGAAGAQALSMKIGTATINDGQHEWMRRFADGVDKATGGKLKPQLFPASQLGSIPRMIEGVQLGTIESYVGPGEFFVGVDPRFQVLGAPGVFETADQVVRTIGDPAFRDRYLSLGEAKNLKGIDILYLGTTGIVFTKPVRTLDDFKGKKIRVFGSPMHTTPMQMVGAAGTPLPLDEVLPSLQNGVVDGAFGTAAIFIPMKFYNLAKYWTVTNASPVTTLVVVGKSWFDKLPADVQKAIVDVPKEIGPPMVEWCKDFDVKAQKAWVEAGGELIQLPPADRAEMMKRWSAVGTTVLADKPAVKEVYDLMVRTAKSKL
ncbi:MAG: TRAP transporter substrate-binding protein [Rhodospirillales bacterium]